MSYQGSILIREPELQWPIVVLAGIVTARDRSAGRGSLLCSSDTAIRKSVMRERNVDE
jgi:hypothetical protein